MTGFSCWAKWTSLHMISEVRALPPGELTRRTMAFMLLSKRALRMLLARSGPMDLGVCANPISPCA